MEPFPPPPGLPAPPPSPRPRTFQCSSALWESLEQAAREQSRPVDQLITEALARYLQQQPAARPRPAPPPLPSAPPAAGPPPSGHPSAVRASQVPAFRPPLPAPPARAAQATPPAPAAPPAHAAPRSTAPQAFPLPPPPQRGRPPAPPPLPQPAARERLAVLHAGRRYEVEASGFVIGRGKQLAGLTIKDPNISRRHAVIEEENGAYFLVDLGSTNGTLINGVAIKRHPIREGDVARIADEELLFTFRR